MSHVKAYTWTPALTANDWYLLGSHSGAGNVHASTRSPGSRDCQVANATTGLTPIAGGNRNSPRSPGCTAPLPESH